MARWSACVRWLSEGPGMRCRASPRGSRWDTVSSLYLYNFSSLRVVFWCHRGEDIGQVWAGPAFDAWIVEQCFKPFLLRWGASAIRTKSTNADSVPSAHILIKLRQHLSCLGRLCCISIPRDDLNYDFPLCIGLVILCKRVSLIKHVARLTRVSVASR